MASVTDCVKCSAHIDLIYNLYLLNPTSSQAFLLELLPQALLLLKDAAADQILNFLQIVLRCLPGMNDLLLLCLLGFLPVYFGVEGLLKLCQMFPFEGASCMEPLRIQQR